MKKHLSLASLVVGALAAVTLIGSQSASAVVPPESCFAFNQLGRGEITRYYDNEDNNPANPACPHDVDIPATIGGEPVVEIDDAAFQDKGLTAVTIPNSVTRISASAFELNELTSVTIPNSVTYIDESAFSANQLTQVVLGDSVAYIGSSAFSLNQLTAVTIPDSVAAIESNAFELQNFQGSNPNNVDPSDFNATPYVQLYTESVSNTNNLQDAFNSRCMEWDPDFIDCLEETPSGGHIINPTTVAITYKNDAGDTLKDSVVETGIDGLTTYLVNDNDTDDLSRYYRMSTEYSFSAPAITGYDTITPASPYITTLDASRTNTIDFVYTAVATPTEPQPQQPGGGEQDGDDESTDAEQDATLAETGFNTWAVVAVAGLLLVSGTALTVATLRRSATHRHTNGKR